MRSAENTIFNIVFGVYIFRRKIIKYLFDSLNISYIYYFFTVFIMVVVGMVSKKYKLGMLFGYGFLIFSYTVLSRKNYGFRMVELLPFWSYKDIRLFPQIICNVLIFIPIGYLLTSVFRKKYIFVGFLFSVFIEIMQLVLRRGLFEFDDIMHNSIGVLLGYYIFSNKDKGVYKLYKLYLKRVFDVILSFLALVILFPLLIITAILVCIKLGKPIIYCQERPGKNEKIFRMYKFRSMTNGRDENGELLPDAIRLTKFGRFIRSTSLDELPELINILKGDMSIVGPRPLAVEYLPYYTNKERHRHDVRPGLTGLAQVNGRNSISWDAKFRYDIEYVENISLTNDIRIIFRTIKKVFIREGIGQGESHPGSLYDVRKDWLDDEGRIKLEYQEGTSVL